MNKNKMNLILIIGTIMILSGVIILYNVLEPGLSIEAIGYLLALCGTAIIYGITGYKAGLKTGRQEG